MSEVLISITVFFLLVFGVIGLMYQSSIDGYKKGYCEALQGELQGDTCISETEVLHRF